MIMDTNIREITTVEEFTIFGIERSVAGIAALIEDAGSCSALLEQNNRTESLNRLAKLTQNLHDFSVFENDACSLLEIDNTKIKHGRSTLNIIEQQFRLSLDNLGSKIESKDLNAIRSVLMKEVTPALKKMKQIMPVLSNYIDKTYVQDEQN